MILINLQLLQKRNTTQTLNDDFSIDLQEGRSCFELAIEQFGKNDIDLWISYIKFERDYGSVKDMKVLFERGKILLKPELLNSFTSQYELVVNMLQ